MKEERLKSIAYEEARRVYEDNGPDLLVKDAPLEGGFDDSESVDVLVYSHGSYDVKMIGIYEGGMEDKRQLARRWLDFFLSQGFVNVRGTLKKADRESEYPGENESLDGDYLFSQDLDDVEREEIWSSLRGSVDVEAILDGRREAEPENLNL